MFAFEQWLKFSVKSKPYNMSKKSITIEPTTAPDQSILIYLVPQAVL